MRTWTRWHVGAVAAALVVGVAIGIIVRTAAPPTPVHATATMGSENFAVATGLVDDGVEAFYFLDFLTGTLKATVVNTRDVGFSAYYEYDITADFPTATQNPKYLMVTGMANIPRGRGRSQLARSVVYITEVTTGRMAAYIMPWDSTVQARGGKQQGTFYNIGTVPLRADTFVRDQP